VCFQHFLDDGFPTLPSTEKQTRRRRPGRARRTGSAAPSRSFYFIGLDLAELADQYLEFGRDARKAAATRTWLVTAFVGAARKRHDFATARLLAIRPAALAAPAVPTVPTPSLEDFAAEHDPDGFYTEKELLDLFAAQHASDSADAGATLRRQQRNARLRARQMAALDALARLLVEDPQPEHHVLGWFDTAVALRLADVGIDTIGRLVETINAVGYRWYRSVPRAWARSARAASPRGSNTTATSTACGSRPTHGFTRPSARCRCRRSRERRHRHRPVGILPDPGRPRRLAGRTAIRSRTTAARTTTCRRSTSGWPTTRTRTPATNTAPRPNACCCGRSSRSASRCPAST
jgi:hypothetical protein